MQKPYHHQGCLAWGYQQLWERSFAVVRELMCLSPHCPGCPCAEPPRPLPLTEGWAFLSHAVTCEMQSKPLRCCVSSLCVQKSFLPIMNPSVSPALEFRVTLGDLRVCS